MATLGSTGKADPSQFDRKRKLFLVPLVTVPPQLEEQISDLADTHWDQIKGQLQNLEKSLGTIRHVFHELIHDEGKAGEQLLSQIAPRSASLIKEITDSSGHLEQTEDQDLLFELSDWQRFLSIGLVSQKVSDLASASYQTAMNDRYEYIGKQIDETLEEDGVAALFISEDHRVQFPSDIQVFYVSPPSQNQLKQSIINLMQKSFEESQADPNEEVSNNTDKEVE